MPKIRASSSAAGRNDLWLGCQSVENTKLCGSQPAGDGGGTVNINGECQSVIASRLAPTGGLHFSCEIGGFYVELRRDRVRSNADLFVDGMRGYWASSAQRTQLKKLPPQSTGCRQETRYAPSG